MPAPAQARSSPPSAEPERTATAAGRRCPFSHGAHLWPQTCTRRCLPAFSPLCALPPERAPFWLAVPLQRPVLKDSLEGAPWLCPGSSERGRNPCGPGRWGWGRNPLGLETTTAPSLQRGARRPLLRLGRDPQSHCLPEAHRPAHLPGAAILLLGKQWSKRRIRILFVHFSKVSFSFVPECDPLPARTHRYPLVPGSLDFFFVTLIL